MPTLDILETPEDEPEEQQQQFPGDEEISDVILPLALALPLTVPARSSKRSSPSLKLTMPKPTEMIFHSPSDQIVGTPFSINNSPRFEYPFPQSNTNSVESTPSLAYSTASRSTVSSPSPLILSPPLERLYSPTHPKLCTADPPMPPSLLKKPKWAMGLLGRKSTATGSLAGKGNLRDNSTKLSSEHHTRPRRFSVGTPPELYSTPLEHPDGFFPSTSGLNRTTSAQC